MSLAPITKGAPPMLRRPRCPNCHRPLTPWYSEVDANGDTWTGSKDRSAWTAVARVFTGYDSRGHFCTLRCGTEFANRIVSGRATTKKGV